MTDELGKLSYSAYLPDEDALKLAQSIDPHYEIVESTKDYKVYRDPLKNRTVVSFKGSGADVNDWKENALTLFHLGHYTNNYKNGLKTVKGLIDKYGKEAVECVGHSRGGSACSAISKTTGIKSTTFSKPKQIGFTKNAKNETSIATAFDPVQSALIPGLPVKSKKIIPKSGNPHSAKNFI